MKPSFKSYLVGFIASIVFTLAAFLLVYTNIHAGHTIFKSDLLTNSVIILAVVQMVVQLIFFLHLSPFPKKQNNGQPEEENWDFVIFMSTLAIILILVICSLWIMQHLNYNMTPDQIMKYMKAQG